ncbi:MAG: cation:proton antiporter, partial [Gammaproteobacteria bacterium]
GAGVRVDVIVVFVGAFVSVWMGEKTAATTVVATLVESEVLRLTVSIGIFIVLAWLCYRWLAGWLSHWLPSHPRHLTLLSMLMLFGFGGFAEYSELGMVVGAITAGVILRPVYNRMAAVGEHTTQAIRAVTYGFLGLVFFFWVGLSVDLGSMLTAPMLTILLYLAATLGKLAGVFIMVPMRRLNSKEAWAVGIGLNARLTTEIVVAKLLLDAKLIDAHVFTALVSAASFSAITVPLVFTFLVRAWGDQLRYTPSQSPLEEDNAR